MQKKKLLEGYPSFEELRNASKHEDESQIILETEVKPALEAKIHLEVESPLKVLIQPDVAVVIL